MPRPAESPQTVVVLAAGQGTRMRSSLPKVLHSVCGRPMLAWVLEQAFGLEPERVLVVVGHGAGEVRAAVAEEGFGRAACVVQEPQLGTGHAVAVALSEAGSDPGRVAVLYGDMPVVRVETLRALCAAQAGAADPEGRPGAALLTAEPPDPRGFGRVLRGASGDVLAVVEERDASPEERALREVNLGVYVFPGRELVAALPGLSRDNAQDELYLTDVIAAFAGEGRRVVTAALGDSEEAIGVNDLVHLSEARRALQARILAGHMRAGVRVEDPGTTAIDWGVEIGPGTRIEPSCVIRRGARIGRACRIGPFAHVPAGARVPDGAEVGGGWPPSPVIGYEAE